MNNDPPIRARPPNSNPTRYATWRDIPLPELRAWVADLADQLTYRGVAAVSRVSASAVQDFAKGQTHPQRKTRQVLGELYMQQLDAHHLSERWRQSGEVPQLRTLLPEGEDAALAFIDDVLEGRVNSGPQVEVLLAWLETVVRAEYEAEVPYEHLKRKRRRPRRDSTGVPGSAQAPATVRPVPAEPTELRTTFQLHAA